MDTLSVSRFNKFSPKSELDEDIPIRKTQEYMVLRSECAEKAKQEDRENQALYAASGIVMFVGVILCGHGYGCDTPIPILMGIGMSVLSFYATKQSITRTYAQQLETIETLSDEKLKLLMDKLPFGRSLSSHYVSKPNNDQPIPLMTFIKEVEALNC
jgi:hypothetical protein